MQEMIPIVDCHVHMDVRNANDYELMAVSGVQAVVVPCSFTGEQRPDAGSYARYYDRLLGLEKSRAEAYGIQLFVAVGVDPCDMQDEATVAAAIEALPRYFGRPGVCALGELELKSFTDLETSAFVQQLRLADRHQVPILLKAPRLDKHNSVPRMVEVLARAIRDFDLDPSRIMFFDLTLGTLDYAWKLGLGGYGIPVSPTLDSLFVIHEKASPEEAREILARYGADRLMFNTALHFGFGDPLALSKVLLYLRQKGVLIDDLRKVFNGNSRRFLWNERI